jgi:hypothetical protein
LVAALCEHGLDAYGVDPRTATAEEAALGGQDLRGEPVLEHLRAVRSGSLAAVVLSGVVEPMAGGDRRRLVARLADVLAPGGTLFVHSVSPAAWSADSAPPEVDLAAGAPYRPGTWTALLPFAGFDVDVVEGADRLDYLVTARRGHRAP